jgi:hypothetical protein
MYERAKELFLAPRAWNVSIPEYSRAQRSPSQIGAEARDGKTSDGLSGCGRSLGLSVYLSVCVCVLLTNAVIVLFGWRVWRVVVWRVAGIRCRHGDPCEEFLLTNTGSLSL